MTCSMPRSTPSPARSGRHVRLALAGLVLACIAWVCTPLHAQAPQVTAPTRAAAPPSIAANPIDTAALDAQIEAMLLQWQQPGVALALVADGRIVHERGFGIRRAGDGGGTVDAQTLFGIASVSKSFASAAIARLVADGKADWDDPVVRHLPWFRMPRERDSDEVTLRDMLAMRSGIGSSEYAFRRASANRRDHVYRVRYLPQVHPLRSEYLYTTDSYTVLGEVVAQISGMPWERFVADAFWQPLGMRRTNADHRVARADANAASPHLSDRDGRKSPIEWIYEDYNALPAGGVNASAHDLALWLRFHLAQGSVDGRPLLPAAVLAQTHQAQTIERGPHADSAWAEVAGDGDERIRHRSYAMGWFVHDYHGHQVIWHSGGIDGFRSRIGFVPSLGLGIVALANSDEGLFPLAVFQTALDHALGLGDSGHWSRRVLQRAQADRHAANERRQALEARRLRNTRPSLPLPRYTGCFADAGAFGRGEVTLEGDRLVISTGRMQYDLTHWHHDVFEARPRWPYEVASRNFFVDFRLRPDGGIDGFDFSTGYRFRPCD